LEQDFFMGWFILAHIFSTILSLIQVGRLSDKDKDLEVIILRPYHLKTKIADKIISKSWF